MKLRKGDPIGLISDDESVGIYIVEEDFSLVDNNLIDLRHLTGSNIFGLGRKRGKIYLDEASVPKILFPGLEPEEFNRYIRPIWKRRK